MTPVPKQIVESLGPQPTFVAILVDLTEDDANAFKVFKNLRLTKEGYLRFGEKVAVSTREVFPWI